MDAAQTHCVEYIIMFYSKVIHNVSRKKDTCPHMRQDHLPSASSLGPLHRLNPNKSNWTGKSHKISWDRWDPLAWPLLSSNVLTLPGQSSISRHLPAARWGKPQMPIIKEYLPNFPDSDLPLHVDNKYCSNTFSDQREVAAHDQTQPDWTFI